MSIEMAGSLSQQESAMVQQVISDILNSVIATAVQQQESATEATADVEETREANLYNSAASAAAELFAAQTPRGSLGVPSLSWSCMSLTKEGVDQSCDGAFGIECMEAEGPAESWLVEASELQAATTDGSRIFCKGPSWDRFEARMARQPATAGSALAVKNDLAGTAGEATQDAAALLRAYEQTKSAVLYSSSSSSSSKRLVSAMTEEATAGKLQTGRDSGGTGQGTTHEGAVCSLASSRCGRLNGSVSPCCIKAGKATARPSTARISLRSSTDRLAASGNLSRAGSVDSKAAGLSSSIERLHSGSRSSISHSSSITVKQSGWFSPGKDLRRSTGSLPVVAGFSITRSGSLRAAEVRSSVDCVLCAAAGSNSCNCPSGSSGNPGDGAALRSSTERPQSGAGARESDAWMASLRTVSRSSSSGGKAPAMKDSQRRLTSSCSTPARPSTAGHLTCNVSSRNITPTTPVTRTSAPGKPARCASAKTSMPITPPPSSAAAGTPSSAGMAGGTPMSRSSSSSSKYSLRFSRPTTPVLASNPTSPVMSPHQVKPAAGGTGSAAKGAAAASSSRKGYTGIGTSAYSSGGKVSQAAPGGHSSSKHTQTSAAAGPGRAARQHSASIASMHPQALSRVSDAQVATTAAVQAVQSELSTRSSREAAFSTALIANADVAGVGVTEAAGSRTGGSISPLALSPKSDEQKEQLWTADTAAVQLFMDEYTEVLLAIDMALSSDTQASQVAASGVLKDGGADAGTQHMAAAEAGMTTSAAGPAAVTAGAAAATFAGSPVGSVIHDQWQQQRQLDALEKKLELELGLRAKSCSADVDYTIAAAPAAAEQDLTDKLANQAGKGYAVSTASAAVADEAVIAEVEVAAVVVDASKRSEVGIASAAAAAPKPAARKQAVAADDVKVPVFGCFACFTRRQVKV